MIPAPQMPKFPKAVILMDANYVDSVVYDFIVHLQNDLGRDIPDCDLPRLLLCNAIDGGVKEGNEELRAILVCHKDETQMGHVIPHNLMKEVNGFAFDDESFGEVEMTVLTEEDKEIMGTEPLLVQIADVALSSPDIEKLIVVADWQQMGDSLDYSIREALENTERKTPIQVTVVTTAFPVKMTTPYSIVPLGYALLHCLGVSPDELNN